MSTKRFPKLPLPGSLGVADHLSVISDAAEISPIDTDAHAPVDLDTATDGPLADRDFTLDGLEKKAKLGAWLIAFAMMAFTLGVLVLALAF